MVRSLQYAFLAIIVTTVGFSLYQWNASRASTQKTAPNNGLVGYWSFNEGTGTLAGDASGNGNTGTLTNGPTWTSGKRGTALSFDGTDDLVSLANEPNFDFERTNPLTFSAWIKTTSTAPIVQVIASKIGVGLLYNGWDFALHDYTADSSALMFQLVSDNASNKLVTATASGTITAGKWTHVAATYTGNSDVSGVTLYINGISVAKATNINTLSSSILNNVTPAIGKRASDNTWPFSGQIDEVRIYNRALSGTEVTNLYNLGVEKLNVSPVSNLTSGLVGYWTFDGKDTPWSSSSAGTATDRSGNSNTGTLTNMSRATTPTIGKLGQALNFDGVDDYVTVPHNSVLNFAYNQDFSVSLWMKVPPTQNDTSVGTNDILQKWSNSGGYPYAIRLFNQTYGVSGDRGKVFMGRYDGTNNPGVASTSLLNDTTWHLVTGTKLGSTLSMYIDGVLQQTVTDTTTGTTTNVYPLYIGLRDGGIYPFTGQIDEVRIYNRALSAGEIQSLYDLGASDKVNSSVSQNQGTGRLDSGLAGYWKLDDGSGTTATDSSGNGSNGTLTNGPTWGTGQIGGDVVFDGTDDYVDSISLSGLPTATNTISIVFWGKTITPGFDSVIQAMTDDASNRINIHFPWMDTVYWDFGDIASGGRLSVAWDASWTNQWAHWSFISEAGVGQKIYRNGILLASDSSTSTFTKGTKVLQFARHSTTNYWNGSIDEVRVYNRALSDDEVSQLYRLTTPTGVDTSLKGYWSFNGADMNGTTAYDRSGSANNGTLTNGPTKTIGKLGQALSFDGVNTRVNLGNPAALQITGNLTITAWVKANPLPNSTNYAIVYGVNGGNGNGYEFLLNRSDGSSRANVMGLALNGNTVYSTNNAFVDNNWSFVAVTYDHTNARFYANGVAWGAPADSSTITDSANNKIIGNFYNGGADAMNGSIDEVRIYNRALTATEISSLYNSGR